MSKHSCRWVLSPERPALFRAPLDKHRAVYCGEPLGYTIKIDPETGLKRRYYQPFCAEHIVEAAKQEHDDE